MLVISHRANIDGPNEETENTINSIKYCLEKGISVEIDIWHKNNQLYLGHDEPQYKIDFDFLKLNYCSLWIHCKNFEALEFFSNYIFMHFFWHENDKFTLTSHNFIWTYPNQNVCNKSVIVCQSKEETKKYLKENCFGVCTDYINLT